MFGRIFNVLYNTKRRLTVDTPAKRSKVGLLERRYRIYDLCDVFHIDKDFQLFKNKRAEEMFALFR